MKTFVSQLHEHLATYKRGLGITQDGVWRGNGRAYPHILPIDERERNILEPFRTQFWAYAETVALLPKLHGDFHHLSSSQALAFNVFFPFVGTSQGEAAILLRAIGLAERTILSFEFESVPDKGEGTSFDFCALFADGTRLLVEVKLSEAEFGTCRDDERHRMKLESVYRERLHGKVIQSMLDSSRFFTQYQLLRNVSHLRQGDTLVLLVPRGNRRTFAQAEEFMEGLTAEIRPAIRLVALEDLLDALTTVPDSHACSIAKLLKAKYLPSGL